MGSDIASRRRRQRVEVSETETSDRVNYHLHNNDDINNDDINNDNADWDSETKKGHDSKISPGGLSSGRWWMWWNSCRSWRQQPGQQYVCWASRCRGRTLWAYPASSSSLPRPNANMTKDRVEGRKKTHLLDCLLIAGIVSFSVIFVLGCFPGVLRIRVGPRRGQQRWRTDAEVNKIPVEIPLFDFDRRKMDIGGWQFFHHFFLPNTEILTTERYPGYFGGLEFVGPFGAPRITRPDEGRVAEIYLELMRNNTRKVAITYEHTEEIQDVENPCQRNNWMQAYKPLCNALHELDLAFDFNEDRAGLGDHQMFDSFYISHGYWRDVWVVHQRDQDIKSVLKKSRWKHDYDSEVFYMTLNDALIMERLTKSPRVVMYMGHCGFSVWVEAIPYEIETAVVTTEGYSKQEDLLDNEELKPKNDFTDEERLSLALTMAESLADLHGFEDGLIIHDDVQLCQWLQTKDGKLKLGDFNRAEFPLFDQSRQEYCKFNNGRGYGNYRSPEEYSAKDFDEKIDVWSFGNNIYALLTGLWIFYEDEDDAIVQKKILAGQTAFIDDRYRSKSFISKSLVEIMEKCWVFNPQDRIDIFEALRLLRETRTEYERRKAADEIKR